jgi:hypothetical protein
MELQTRKLVERGKRIVQWELGLSEHEALLVLQRQSQQRMKAIILSAEVRQSIGQELNKKGAVAKWQGKGLQNPHRRFDSAPRLQVLLRGRRIRARTIKYAAAILELHPSHNCH